MFSLIYWVAITQVWIFAADKTAACIDTPNWFNGFTIFNGGKGHTCKDYITQGWCANGRVVPGCEWTLGALFNFPEKNCVACGKTDTNAGGTTSGVGDTPNWCNGYSGVNGGKGYTCQQYVTQGWCANGRVVPGCEWTLGAQYNYPEKNCVACGKSATNAAPTPSAAAPTPSAAAPTTSAAAPTTSAAAPTTSGCPDTPNWHNGYGGVNGGKGYTCQQYVTQGWCANGRVVPGSEWALGAQYNYPEKNCVACGKGATNGGTSAPTTSAAVPTTSGCADTPNWCNGDSSVNGGKGYTCRDYVAQGWCADGGVVPGSEWTLGAQYNYPEKNCVVCGKGAINADGTTADVTDTPNWCNGDSSVNGGKGYTCQDYVAQGWCADGGVVSGFEGLLGVVFNFPENNCVACGKWF